MSNNIYIVICGTCLYGCGNSISNYYKIQTECINNGGSWIPQSSPYNAACNNGDKR